MTSWSVVTGATAAEMLGPYRLLSRLGAGGMGEGRRALDTRKDREVAVKMLGAWIGGEPGFAARFRREAALAARLNAPNIIPIHDYGEINGQLFMEMPLIKGTNLTGLVARQGGLDPVRAVGVIEQIAEALDTAHAAGMVHRDVKPSNVLIAARRGGGDFVHLIDFGIACTADGTRLTATGRELGRPLTWHRNGSRASPTPGRRLRVGVRAVSGVDGARPFRASRWGM